MVIDSNNVNNSNWIAMWVVWDFVGDKRIYI